jgi:hypothetical protein
MKPKIAPQVFKDMTAATLTTAPTSTAATHEKIPNWNAFGEQESNT